MRYALYKEVAKRRRQKRKKRKLNHGGATAGKGEDGSQDSSDEDSDEEDEDDEQPETPERVNLPQQQPKAKGGKLPEQPESQNSLWQDDSQDVRVVAVPAAAADPVRDGVQPERYVKQPSSSRDTTADPTKLFFPFFHYRLQLFRSRVANLFASSLQDEEQIFLAELVELVNAGLPTDGLFGTAEATAICKFMTDSDELMLSDGIIYKV